MVINMESKYLLAATIAIATVSIFAIGIANAHGTNDYTGMMGNGFGGGMMGGNFVHDQDNVDWMKDEMKEHMNLTNEEVNEMTEHCPMMRGR